MDHCLFIIHDPFHYGRVSKSFSHVFYSFIQKTNRITYSMGQVFLEPMRNELSLARASVSTIFSILPAVTLGAGQLLVE
jgi:hypothetical protein